MGRAACRRGRRWAQPRRYVPAPMSLECSAVLGSCSKPPSLGAQADSPETLARTPRRGRRFPSSARRSYHHASSTGAHRPTTPWKTQCAQSILPERLNACPWNVAVTTRVLGPEELCWSWSPLRASWGVLLGCFRRGPARRTAVVRCGETTVPPPPRRLRRGGGPRTAPSLHATERNRWDRSR